MNNALAADTAGASSHRQSPLAGRLIDNPRLKYLQHAHSLAMTLLGMTGVLVGGYRAFFVVPLDRFVIGTFLCCFVLVGLGITAGFHRLYTHRSFKAKPAVKAALAILGCMAGQGPVVFWVALHRWHHEYADREGDPHSPNLFGPRARDKFLGLCHASIGWTVKHEVPNANFYARDILRDPLVMSINRLYYVWIILGLLLPSAVCGVVLTSWEAAFDGLIWGGFIRMFAVHGIIYWLTSFAHVFGKREFDSRDGSTNSLWMALPTLGEAWHNNHHAFPQAASLTFKWWQLDITGLFIKVLSSLGLVWDVRQPEQATLDSKRIIKL